jgi:ankyrin repeat protein
MTPLQIACQHVWEDIAILLIDATSIDLLTNLKSTSPNTPLHLACRNSHESLLIVKKILNRIKDESEYDLNTVLNRLDSQKQTPLNIAIEKNHLNIIDMMLKEFYLDEKDSEDKNGNLPVHIAARSGSVEILKILAKNDAVSFRNNASGDNAMHIAAENNKFNFIRELIAFEKDYVIKNKLVESHVPMAKCYNR